MIITVRVYCLRNSYRTCSPLDDTSLILNIPLSKPVLPCRDQATRRPRRPHSPPANLTILTPSSFARQRSNISYRSCIFNFFSRRHMGSAKHDWLRLTDRGVDTSTGVPVLHHPASWSRDSSRAVGVPWLSADRAGHSSPMSSA